jgi:hypothetical protein
MSGPIKFPWIDNEVGATRGSLIKMQAQAAEGFYYAASNGQTAIADSGATAYSATAATLLIQNNNPLPGQQQQANALADGAPVNIYVDYIRLMAATAGSAASGLSQIAFALYLDNILRYSSGGTALTPANMNSYSPSASGAQIYFGTVVAKAANAAKAAVGMASMRPTVSGTAIGVVSDQYVLDCGATEGGMGGSIAPANPVMLSIPLPPIVIPPQCSAMLSLWYPGGATMVAPTWLPEIGFWER